MALIGEMHYLTIGENTYSIPTSGGSTVSITRSLTSGTKSATISVDGTSYDLYAPTPNAGTVTSVRVQATSPVQSSTSTAQSSTLNTTISLADGYGDTKNPYGTKTKNYVLAGPTTGSAAAPSFRALVAADIPDLSEIYLTSYTETDPTVPSWAKASTKPTYTASEVGAVATSAVGAASGVVPLNASSKIDSTYLPSYVDDVIEGYYYNNKFYTTSAHTTQITGETGKIFVDLSTNKTYRYGGSAFTEVSQGSIVSISRSLTSGTKSATITVDGTGYDLYAPTPPTVPTNVSAFTNDAGYITSADVPEGASAYTGTISAVGTSASTGTNNGFARGDHVHNITKTTIDSVLGTGSGTTKFYREDGSWAIPDYTINTDTKVTQGNSTSTQWRKVLLNYNASDDAEAAVTSVTGQVYASPYVSVKASDGSLHLGGTLTSAKINSLITGGTQTAAVTTSPYKPALWKFNAGITPTNGDVVFIQTPGGGHSYGEYLSLDNGTTYKPITHSGTSKMTTHYGSGSAIMLVYDSDWSTSSMYPLAGGTSTSTITGGAWRVINGYLDGNTYTTAYCSTAAATAAKSASMNGYAATANRHVMVTMTTANSAASAITLNINGTGAKPIYINGSASSSSNHTLPAGSYLVYYNGTNYYFRTDGLITGGITGNAATVGGHSVGIDVPSTAKFTDTWNANAVSTAGYVAAPTTSNPYKVWGTNSSGTPSWKYPTILYCDIWPEDISGSVTVSAQNTNYSINLKSITEQLGGFTISSNGVKIPVTGYYLVSMSTAFNTLAANSNLMGCGLMDTSNNIVLGPVYNRMNGTYDRVVIEPKVVHLTAGVILKPFVRNNSADGGVCHAAQISFVLLNPA